MKKNFLEYKIKGRASGVWLSFLALTLILLAWIMQAFSLINWELAVEYGLQNGSFEGDAVAIATATKERGEAVADLIWVLPLTIVALIGLWKNRLIGFVAAMMTFAICIYFPLFYVFQLWHTHLDTAIAAVFLWAIPSMIGITGLWVNRTTFKK